MIKKNIHLLILLVCSNLFFSRILSIEEKNLIERMHVEGTTIKYFFHPQLHEKFLKEDLFVEYESDIDLGNLSYEVLSAPAVLNLFSIIWFSGEDYYVESMEKGLFEALIKMKKLLQRMFPKAKWTGNIIPRTIVDLSAHFAQIHDQSSSRALLFSCGVDSTSLYLDHLEEKLHLITAWGHPDMGLKNPKGFERVRQYVKRVASMYGHTASFIKSNYCDMFNWDTLNSMGSPEIVSWRLCTMEIMSFAGLILPILIAKKCSSFYMASGNSWYIQLPESENPFCAAAFNFANFSAISDQFDLTRFLKTKKIIELVKQKNLEKPFIKACKRKADKACGQCQKCCLLMITLMVLGEEIKEYGFDLSEEAAVKSMMVSIESIDLWKWWCIKELQVEARKIVQGFHRKKKVLAPFLQFDLDDPAIISQLDPYTEIGWEVLKQIIPEVEIPTNLSQELLELAKLLPCDNRKK